jgi:hypothetical protein
MLLFFQTREAPAKRKVTPAVEPETDSHARLHNKVKNKIREF